MARYVVNFICPVPWEGGLLRQGTAALLVLLMLHLESGSRADALSHGAQGRAGADPDLGEGRESVVPISELESWEQTTELGPQVIQGRGGLVAVLGGPAHCTSMQPTLASTKGEKSSSGFALPTPCHCPCTGKELLCGLYLGCSFGCVMENSLCSSPGELSLV